jgi:hypothetical protein
VCVCCAGKQFCHSPAVAGGEQARCAMLKAPQMYVPLSPPMGPYIPAKAYTHTARMKNSVNIEALENLIINDSSVMQVSPACVRASFRREECWKFSAPFNLPLSLYISSPLTHARSSDALCLSLISKTGEVIA